MKRNARDNPHDYRKYKTMLDDKEIQYCFNADTDQGWAEVYKTDISGFVMIDVNFNPLFERLYGKVELIEIK